MQRKSLIALLGAVAVMSACVSTALAYYPDPTLLDIKGYSGITIDAVKTQSHRQEWRQPPEPRLNLKQRIFRNFLLDDWTGNFDDFGSYKIREKQ